LAPIFNTPVQCRGKLASKLELRYLFLSENGVFQCSEKAGSAKPHGCDAPGTSESGGSGGTAAAGIIGRRRCKMAHH
jgi:hypothetical protein